MGVVLPVDDEGTDAVPTTLLSEGRLVSYLHTRDSAASAETAPTGNGRAMDARFPPIVRMRNTFFEPGDASVEEALRDLGDGYYLCGGRGGMPSSDGSFVFTATHGYRVAGGEVVAPVRPATLFGNILDFLQNVRLLTSDFQVKSNYFGGCGKFDQSFIPVGYGGPHVLVSEALVAGEGAS
jgi:TldD protein